MKIEEILTKVYSYTNQMKVYLAFGNLDGVWESINDLNDYLLSIDVSQNASGNLDLLKEWIEEGRFLSANTPEKDSLVERTKKAVYGDGK